MGIVIACDIFERKLDKVYANLPGVTGIADDMIIYGMSTEEHDRNLLRFLKVTRKHNLHLNKDKLLFCKETVDFFGHQWNKDGISPDPKNIKALTSMESPQDKETMQRFLGLVNFLNRYIVNDMELSKPHHDLCALHVDYKVSTKHMEAFQTIKSVLSSKTILPS